MKKLYSMYYLAIPPLLKRKFISFDNNSTICKLPLIKDIPKEHTIIVNGKSERQIRMFLLTKMKDSFEV